MRTPRFGEPGFAILRLTRSLLDRVQPEKAGDFRRRQKLPATKNHHHKPRGSLADTGHPAEQFNVPLQPGRCIDAIARGILEADNLGFVSFDGSGNGLLLKTMERKAFAGFFQPIELSPE